MNLHGGKSSGATSLTRATTLTLHMGQFPQDGNLNMNLCGGNSSGATYLNPVATAAHMCVSVYLFIFIDLYPKTSLNPAPIHLSAYKHFCVFCKAQYVSFYLWRANFLDVIY